MGLNEVPTEPSAREVLLAARFSRISAIVDEIKELKKELRALTGAEDIAGLRTKVTCLRCGYDWWPNHPLLAPRTCARCGSTAWMKPPTRNSRKPTDPQAAWWRGRRQKRKGRARPILRMRPQTKPIMDAIVAQAPWEKANPPAGDTLMIPPPPDPGITMPPPPDPMWRGSLSAYLKGNHDEPVPEMVTSHPAETSIVTAPEVETEVMPLESSGPTPGLEESAGDHTEPASVTSVEDVPSESVGQPQTEAEREELARAKEEAWPTTRPD